MQMSQVHIGSTEECISTFEDYIKKNYYKTGSLIANSCKAAAMLAPQTDADMHRVAFEYGVHFGTAFQLVDDAMDFDSNAEVRVLSAQSLPCRPHWRVDFGS